MSEPTPPNVLFPLFGEKPLDTTDLFPITNDEINRIIQVTRDVNDGFLKNKQSDQQLMWIIRTLDNLIYYSRTLQRHEDIQRYYELIKEIETNFSIKIITDICLIVYNGCISRIRRLGLGKDKRILIREVVIAFNDFEMVIVIDELLKSLEVGEMSL